jgi:hypothetical protein
MIATNGVNAELHQASGPQSAIMRAWAGEVRVALLTDGLPTVLDFPTGLACEEFHERPRGVSRR